MFEGFKVKRKTIALIIVSLILVITISAVVYFILRKTPVSFDVKIENTHTEMSPGGWIRWKLNIRYTGTETLKIVYIYIADSPNVDVDRVMPRIIPEVKEGWTYGGDFPVQGTLIVRIIAGDYDETFTS